MGLLKMALTGILVFAFIMAGANKISNEVLSECVFTILFSRHATHSRQQEHAQVCTDSEPCLTDRRHR